MTELIYCKIENEHYTVEEARDFLYEIKRVSNPDIQWSEFATLSLDECCEQLNQEDVFGCGSSYEIEKF